MRHSKDFTATVRTGVKGSTRRVVIHLTTHENGDEPALVGFVVPKAVGIAVRRNLVKRRLRAAVAQRLDTLAGTRLVVRALPASAEAEYAELARDVDRALGRAREADARRDARRGEQDRARP